MNIFMTGGTGFLGTALTRALIREGHAVTILSRSAARKDRLPQGAVLLQGDPTKEGQWQERAAEHEVVINLAGASIFNRWRPEYKEILRQSRLAATHHLVAALARPQRRTRMLLNASAVGYYGFRGDEELDESARPGDDFLARLTQGWEATAQKAEPLGIKVLLCRFGVVLGAGGGAFEKMLTPFKWGLGSPLGSGRQWFSWIHRQDLIGAIVFLLMHPELSGPVNCTAPRPVTNREMTRTLAEVLHRPAFLPPVPALVVKAALGELGSVILHGQRAVPRKLEAAGFSFRFPEIRAAFADLVSRGL